VLKISRNDLLQRQGKRAKRGGLLDDMAKLYKRQKKRPQRREIIIKTEVQIAGIRKSCRLTRDILDAITPRIEPGITTEQINTWVHEMTLEHGAIPAPLNYRGFPKSVCTTLNEQICHGIPTPDRVLQSGDILNIDVTSILDGYYGDSSRMFLVGDVSDEARKLVKVTHAAMYLGIQQVKPDNTLGDVGHAIQQHAESHGYSVVRSFVGHGTGVKFHEPPDVTHYGKPGQGVRLVPNMIFTIEPMINVGTFDLRVLDDGWTAVTADGKLSAQWEHTILVTEDGVEILTE
jgi:methionyl aminopeptidase